MQLSKNLISKEICPHIHFLKKYLDNEQNEIKIIVEFNDNKFTEYDHKKFCEENETSQGNSEVLTETAIDINDIENNEYEILGKINVSLTNIENEFENLQNLHNLDLNEDLNILFNKSLRITDKVKKIEAVNNVRLFEDDKNGVKKEKYQSKEKK